MARPAAAARCADMTGCENCTALAGCHFCPDNRCHAVGSVYGCLSGLPCQTKESACQPARAPDARYALLLLLTCVPPLAYATDCMRHTPQPIGYDAPSAAWIIGALVFLGSVCCCAGMTMFLCSAALEASTETTYARDPQYVQLQELAPALLESGTAMHAHKLDDFDPVPFVQRNSTPRRLCVCASSCTALAKLAQLTALPALAAQ